MSSFWYKISVGRVEKQRYSDVLRDLMLRNDNIKELKLFWLSIVFEKPHFESANRFFREDQMNRKNFAKLIRPKKPPMIS